MKSLFLIPARGGSKGIPRKNIKLLAGKPLIYYTIDIARALSDDADICVSTDDNEIIEVVNAYGLKVPFTRPKCLATDTSSSYEVIMHALSFYQSKGLEYDVVVLLQPTSPFRSMEDVKRCMEAYSPQYDMIVSVKQASSNPYYDCFEADENGYLVQSKGNGLYKRRQDVPKVYEYTGSVYVMNVAALREKDLCNFKKVGFVEMNDMASIDLDTMLDWKFAELMISEKI